MFSFPEAGWKALATAKLPTALRRDGLEGNIALGSAEGAQDSSIYGKDLTQRTFQSHIVFNSREKFHIKPPLSSIATKRKEVRSTLA
jgi:hypothetical protein